MRTHTTTIALALAAALLSMGSFAATGTSQPATVSSSSSDKLAAEYGTLAGSPANAKSLVGGLRDGTTVTLTSTSPGTAPASFTPATGKLGVGNVNIALSLAREDLARQGISSPTPSQLAAALNGGSITGPKGTVSMEGVLAQRSAGLGWGQIANSMGVTLGSLVSASKTDMAGKKADTAGKAKTTGELAFAGKSAASHTELAAGKAGQSAGSQGGNGNNGNAGGNGNSGGNGGGSGGGNGGGKSK